MSSRVAIVLTGGGARRLAGTPKSTLRRGGASYLALALAAVADADAVVVVGDADPHHPAPRYVREDPPGGGPGAGILAGLDAGDPRGEASEVVVLAVDMPGVTPGTVERLRRAAAGRDGAVLLGADERRQLALVLDAHRLRAVRPAGPADGLPVHRLLAGLDLVEVEPEGAEGLDVDTPADLAASHGVSVEPVDAEDWERWARLRLVALEDAPDAFGSRHVDWADADEGRWRSRFDTPRAVFRVAVLDGVDVGMVALQPALGGWSLVSMWVAPGARGRGVVDALVAEVATYAAGQGAEALLLQVREANARARAAYERLGFVVTGEVEDPSAPPALRELEMRRDLRPPAARTDVGVDS
ncbi:GNAT family N-acetyltransferase [Nocardioides sp. CFH 31398]|uniref:GNAT family N-acetyltransferase n=1 Tax=Nocardioides sp. CFH 31398 TaxID=2919579 RepID=UPI001F0710D6|nr:GNAT family N-acetyltransferase [Nocardioides sp. CFH 31398]MCH1865566.1 GNAT family N-acetyltransferase [Nocardioides sp. CFH 31398]